MCKTELNHVKKIRKQLHMSQQELSNLSCVARSTISDIENYHEFPSQLTMIAIASSLNKKASEVFNLSPKILKMYHFCRNTDNNQ